MIHAELKRSGYRDRFDFVTRWAVEPLDLLREVRELRPTVVHFSGHGGARMAGAAESAHGRDVVAVSAPSGCESHGLYFHDAAGGAQVVSPEAIAQTLGAVGASVKMVVLNACFTAPIAEALLAHVDCVDDRCRRHAEPGRCTPHVAEPDLRTERRTRLSGCAARRLASPARICAKDVQAAFRRRRPGPADER